MKQTSLFRALILLAAFVGLAGETEAKPAADAAPGTVAGSAAASTNRPSAAEVDPAAGKKPQIAELKRAAEAEDARKAAAQAEEERRQEAAKVAAEAKAQARMKAQEEAKRLALIEREKQEKERKLRAEEWEARCVIKPVMTDAEIATCKEVWNRPPP